MKFSTLAAIMYGAYIAALFTKDSLAQQFVDSLFVHGDYEHFWAASSLLVSPVFAWYLWKTGVWLRHRLHELLD